MKRPSSSPLKIENNSFRKFIIEYKPAWRNVKHFVITQYFTSEFKRQTYFPISLEKFFECTIVNALSFETDSFKAKEIRQTFSRCE